MDRKKFAGSFLVLVLLIVVTITLVNAIGVACFYSGSELPLEIYPGEEKTVILELQNWDIEEEIILKGKILKGNEIAFLREESVKVPYQVKTPTEMIVKIPAEAGIGDKYNIEYEFRQVGGEGEGMVSFAQGIIRNFDVIVGEEEEPLGKEEEVLREEPGEAPLEEISATWWILGIVVLIIVIVVIWFVVKRRKSRVNLKNQQSMKYYV